MKKSNHITLGGIFVLMLILLVGWMGFNFVSFTISSIFSIILITVFYSLLPDIDHKNSTITWWFFGVGVLGLIFGILELVWGLDFFSPIKLLVFSTILLAATFVSVTVFDHRGFTHSIPAGLLAVIPLFFIFGSFAYCLIGYVAYHSHLVGDGYLLKMR